jgi:hypothetical protein
MDRRHPRESQLDNYRILLAVTLLPILSYKFPDFVQFFKPAGN